MSGWVALAIYDVFLVTDLTHVPDVFGLAAFTRLAVVSPIIMMMIFIVSRNPSVFVREMATCVLPIVIVASLLFLMLVSEAPLRQYQHTGVILVMLFPVIAYNLRFRYAAFGLLVCFLMNAGAVMNVEEIPPEIKQSTIMLILGGGIFTAIASYRIEHQNRLAYLYSLRDRLQNDELDALSKTDPLTGLLNRRAMDEALALLWENPSQDAADVAVLVLDIDRFKAFNDRYGHLEGDVCIKDVARRALAQTRPGIDIAVRFGGEELVFVLPGLDLVAGCVVAERMRAAIEAGAMPHECNEPTRCVTVSIGVAAATPSDFVQPNELILAADAALYVAKRTGRNRVCSPLSLQPDETVQTDEPSLAVAS
ncbi:MAG: GGDEF domain-containing protein [Rhizobiaceae bacterium]|nr:GGDEF domain-containing protein [Rhizobiaceae bacterium]